MTTARQVRRVVEPLLARHPDLALVGHTIFLKPVRHVARAVLFERTGDAARFRLWWGVFQMCELRPVFSLNWSTQIIPTLKWQWASPTLQTDLISAIEDQALPGLRAIQSLDEFHAFASSRDRFPLTTFDLYLLQKVGVDAACGRLATARETCAALATGRTQWSTPGMREEFQRITTELCPLLAGPDLPALARLLHAWEAQTAANLKISHIYEPTPFPFELRQ
jgi:hypothetical protein